MKTILNAIFLALLAIAFALLLIFLMRGHTIAILQPQGFIAGQERTLIITATVMMLVIVIPVFILTGLIAWRYRASNTSATYTPEWEHNYLEEFIWWAVPCTVIAALSIVTWVSTHKLDPYQPLESTTLPITIQVVALDWKWLFIYPAQNIASVNFVEFPADTPIDFEITADSPMNSFWIPQLGGQIYAMPGMVSELHLIADNPGSYNGASANFSGDGFSGMRFTAKATSEDDFNAWVKAAQSGPRALSESAYATLRAPSEDNTVMYYASVRKDLFMDITARFSTPDVPLYAQ